MFNTINGTSNPETLSGGAGTDILIGGDGNDTINGNDGADYLIDGPQGSTTITIRAAADLGGSEFPIMSVMVNGEPITQVTVPDSSAADYTVNVPLPAAFIRTVQLGFLNDTPGTGTTPDRNLRIYSVKVGGQLVSMVDPLASNTSGSPTQLVSNNSRAVYQFAAPFSASEPLVPATADSMTGGLGDDTYFVDHINDKVEELDGLNGGYDTVASTINYTLAPNTEALRLLDTTAAHPIEGKGNDVDNKITGNASNNRLYGLQGNDSLEGAGGNDLLDGGTGDDTLVGGDGDDIYILDSPNDVVVEERYRGIPPKLGNHTTTGQDTVVAPFDYDLSNSYAEDLQLTGTAVTGIGNDFDNNIVGSDQANVLIGADGNDILIGGIGNDTLDGGEGNDRLLDTLGSTTRITINAAASLAGPDEPIMRVMVNDLEYGQVTVKVDSRVSGVNGIAYTFDVNLPQELIRSVTLGYANDFYSESLGDRNIIIYSVTIGDQKVFSPSQSIWTNSPSGGEPCFLYVNDSSATYLFNPLISTGAPASDDSMSGGIGDDEYFVDSANDVVTEASDYDEDGNYQYGGYDQVSSAIDYTLPENVEALRLLNGSAAAKGEGNNLDNKIVGNQLANELQGFDGNDYIDGSAGADSMIGGTGDDTYVLDDLADTVTESLDEGIDTVVTSLNGHVLQDNVENLQLSGGAVTGRGNAAANSLIGNKIANRLYGMGGNDTLAGGGAPDTLEGGSDDDTYLVVSGDVTIIEEAGGGTDSVFLNSVTDYTLSTNVENAEITSTSLSGQFDNTTFKLTGNESANKLVGSFNTDTLSGLGGNDSLEGQGGSDSLEGGLGMDTILAGIGDDTVNGGGGDDLIMGDEGADTLNGDNDNDTIYGGLDGDIVNGDMGDDVLSGDAGQDSLSGSEGNDTIWAGEDDDTLVGGSGDDVLYGEDGDDRIEVGVGSDLAEGGKGNDTFVVSGTSQASNTTLRGGVGSDTYQLDSALGTITIVEDAGDPEDFDKVVAGFNVTLAAGIEGLDLTGSDVTWGRGNNLGNTLVNTSETAVVTLDGAGGNDTLSGQASRILSDGTSRAGDTLSGGADNDTYDLKTGDNIVINELADQGSDTVLAYGKNYARTLGDGSTTSYYRLNVLNVENVTLSEAFTISPNALGDGNGNVLKGNSLANILDGQGGNDTLVGGIGDTLIGGAGSDTYVLDSWSIDMDSNVRSLSIIEAAGTEIDTVLLVNVSEYRLDDNVENVVATVDASLQLDSILVDGNGSANNILGSLTTVNALNGGANNDTLTGGDLDDSLRGADGADRLFGGKGNDVLLGDAGSDSLVGGEGNDSMSADGKANDTLEGGDGNDYMSISKVDAGITVTARGGAGDDRYIYTGSSGGVLNIEEETLPSGGVDTVKTATSFTLQSGLENLVIAGQSTNNPALIITGKGNGGANLLTNQLESGFSYQFAVVSALEGLAGNDTLVSATLNDTLAGGADDDTYELLAGDLTNINELASQGSDTIITHVNNATMLAPDGQQVSAYQIKVANVENITLAETGSLTSLNDVVVNALGNGVGNVLKGNARNNVLDGQGGNDTLYGDSGDTLIGGLNDDTYELAGTSNGTATVLNQATIIEKTAGGLDTVNIRNISNFTLAPEVENINVSVDAGVDFTFSRVIGNTSANTMRAATDFSVSLNGLQGNDALFGGQMSDTLFGDLGDDLLAGGAGDDFLSGGSGIDYLKGEDGNDSLVDTGGSIDTLEGGAGNDRLSLNSSIATGVAATLRGGTGNDTYVLRGASFKIEEDTLPSGGIDTVATNISFTLQDGLENLSIIQGSTPQTLTLTGNGAGNVISGLNFDSVVNFDASTQMLGSVLSGLGGNDTLVNYNGIDTLIGGTGDDVYQLMLENVNASLIQEEVSGGNDTILTQVSNFTDARTGKKYYELKAANVENVTLMDGFGVRNAKGDINANVLRGNNQINILDGQGGNDSLYGGQGDTLKGGADNDTYFITGPQANFGNSAFVSELFDQGIDNVVLTDIAEYSMTANVENASTAMSAGSALATTEVYGNGLGNTISAANATQAILHGGLGNDDLTGGLGNDTLDGGSGSDVLNGQSGSDTYEFIKLGGADRILEAMNVAPDLDVLRFASNIAVTDLKLTRQASGSATLSLTDGTSMSFANTGGTAAVERFLFQGSNRTYTFAELVGALNTGPSSQASIVGTAKQGQTLSVNTASIVDAQGVDASAPMSYTWQRLDAQGNATNVGSGATYVLNAEDVGKNIRALVGYTDLVGTRETSTTALTVAITRDNSAPTGKPTITGTVKQGELLTADASAVADADGRGPVSFTWLRDGTTQIATGVSTYRLQQEDVNKRISVVGTYTDGKNKVETVTSDPTVAVLNAAFAPTGTLFIDGAPLQGQTLYFRNTLEDLDRVVGGFQYTWYKNDAATTQTGSTYILGSGDVGARISVKASYTDGDGKLETPPGSTPTEVIGKVVNGGTGGEAIAGSAGGDSLNGGGGNDTITGAAGNDTIDGGTGNDTINGGLGNDTLLDTSTSTSDVYLWARGDGQDTLTDSGGTSNLFASGDRLDISNATAEQLWFTRSGNDVTMSIIGTSDSLVLKNFYAGTALGSGAIEKFQLKNPSSTADDTLTAANVAKLITAMSTYSQAVGLSGVPTSTILPTSAAKTTLMSTVTSNTNGWA
jgi:trimeric autotransporter adhesin